VKKETGKFCTEQALSVNVNENTIKNAELIENS
jgi:hypothetical protein